jgi:hypothetical protein
MRNVQRWQPGREVHGPSEVFGVTVQDSDPREWIIKPTTKLDASDCQLIAATHNAAIARGEKVLWCESLVNRAGAPIVQISLGTELAQLGIRDARQHVGVLNEAIEAAMSDAVLVRFLRQVIMREAEDQEVDKHTGQLLQMFRDFRDEVLKPTPIESERES